MGGPIAQGFAGQIYDAETGLYYKRRYYKGTGARFLSPDPPASRRATSTSTATVTTRPRCSPTPAGSGRWSTTPWPWGGELLTGVVGQGVGDSLSGRYSGWEADVGAGMGGAAAGETLLYTGNPILAGMAGGAVGNATTQGLRMASGAQPSFDLSSLVIATGVGGLSAALGSVMNTATAPLGQVMKNGLVNNLSLSPSLSCYITSTVLSGVNGA